MRKSGTVNIFVGIITFIGVWVLTSVLLNLRVTGAIMNQFMGIGLIILVILFQDQIKRFLIDIGSRSKWKSIKQLFIRHDVAHTEENKVILAVVYACMSMSKSKTGALIVIRRRMSLIDYERTGDIIDSNVNMRLIENIFFKNSPLHDGAMIISDSSIRSVGCILPVSHDMNIPKNLGLRHRAALGMSQATDAICVVVSEETGNISVAMDGELKEKLSSMELESLLSKVRY